MQYNSCTYVYTWRMYTRVLTCTNTCTYTHSLTHIHTCTHTHTPMHPGKHIGTCADIHIFHLRNHWQIGKPHENPPKKCLPWWTPFWGSTSTMVRQLNAFPKNGKVIFQSVLLKRDDFRKFSEMLRKPEKLPMVEGEQFPNVLVAKLG